jgi:Mg2+ and Co2+ transporter CorA
MEKLESFYNLSKSKQEKKYDKLLKIIEKLEEKRASLQQEVIKESEIDETSSTYHDLSKELIIINKLIKKAKKKNIDNLREEKG